VTLLLVIALAGLSVVPAFAQVPQLIRYQGTLTDSNGSPLTGTYSMTFRFYDAATAGTKVWEEIQTGIPITNGAFSVLLGQVTPLSLTFTSDCWLAVCVSGGAELSPRSRVASVPNAYMAASADKIEESEDMHPANLLKNGSAESWSNGAGAAPDGWTASNTAVSQDTANYRLGQSGVLLTPSAGTGIFKQVFSASQMNYLKGCPVTFCAWVKTSATSKVRLVLSDGTGTTSSADHPGNGTWKMLKAVRTISASATTLEAQVSVDSPASASVDCMILTAGSMPFAFSPNAADSFLVPRVVVNPDPVSTTSSSAVLIPGMSIPNVTVDGTQSVLLTFNANVNYSSPPGEMAFHMRRSGVQITDDSNQAIAPGGGYTARTHAIQYLDKKPPAGTYTYEVYWAVSGNGYGDVRRSRMTATILPDA
jgi:hypothetical protein